MEHRLELEKLIEADLRGNTRPPIGDSAISQMQLEEFVNRMMGMILEGVRSANASAARRGEVAATVELSMDASGCVGVDRSAPTVTGTGRAS